MTNTCLLGPYVSSEENEVLWEQPYSQYFVFL